MSSRPGCARSVASVAVDLVGVMREIVDHRDAARVADRLEPSPQPLEPARARRRIVDAQRRAHASRRLRPARSTHCDDRALSSRTSWRSPSASTAKLTPSASKLQVLAHEVRARAVEAVTDAACRRERPRRVRRVSGSSRFRPPCAPDSRNAANRLRSSCHLLVVEADVRQHRDLGPVEGDRAVAFVDLADEQFGVADQGARERRRRA